MTETIVVGLQMIANSVHDQTEKAMVSRWMQEFQDYSFHKARPKKILAAISEGYDTLLEISAHTQIPQTSVFRILSKLHHAKRIRFVKKRNHLGQSQKHFEIV